MRHLLSAAVLCVFVVLAMGSNDKDPKAAVGGQLEPYAIAYLNEQQILRPGERIRVYYDVTVALDSSEFALVTDQRVLYYNQGQVNALPLAEVVDISTTDLGILGTAVEARGSDGSLVRVEIAAMQGGELFHRELVIAHEAALAAPDDDIPEADLAPVEPEAAPQSATPTRTSRPRSTFNADKSP